MNQQYLINAARGAYCRDEIEIDELDRRLGEALHWDARDDPVPPWIAYELAAEQDGHGRPVYHPGGMMPSVILGGP